MGIALVDKTVNQLDQGTVLFEEGEDVKYIGILLGGRVMISGHGMKSIADAGTFLGLSDIFDGKYQARFIVAEKASVFAYPVSTKEDVRKLLEANKDYPGLMVRNLLRQLDKTIKQQSLLTGSAVSSMKMIQEKKQMVDNYAGKYGFKLEACDMVDTGREYENSYKPEEQMARSYIEAAAVAPDVLKTFYASAKTMALRQIAELSAALNKLQKDNQKTAQYLLKIAESMTQVKYGCYMGNISRLIGIVEHSGSKCEDLKKSYDELEVMTQEIIRILKTMTSIDIKIPDDVWDGLRTRRKNASNEVVVGEKSNDEILTEFDGCYSKIVAYAGFEKEKAEALEKGINEFMDLKDKYSTEDNVRRLRRTLLDLFYDLYHKVFVKTLTDTSENRIIDLFLNYALIDERLLERQQLILLYHHHEEETNGEDRINVYSAKEWLKAIYEMKKTPSKNEFDMDYVEYLRDLKKNKSITEEQERKQLEDADARLEFEIKNMFKYNCRIVSGQITTFVPFIHKDMFAGDMARMFMSKELVKTTIETLTEVDYSIFYREVLLVDEENGIKKEYIQKEVVPDIVMLPMYGDRASMWQEISGRKRDTPGRILMPVLSDSLIQDMFIPAFGRYRWELCRTIQGTAWNDIKVKSLTSEYSDYIQFFKKNKDLTEERKEKLKAQIQKGKNNVKEVFTMDYETWMKNESQGAMRLNKVAREILAMYCPFNKDIRTNLCKQGIYDEAMQRFHRETQRKLKEFEAKMRHLEQEGGIVTPPLEATLAYYRDR